MEFGVLAYAVRGLYGPITQLVMVTYSNKLIQIGLTNVNELVRVLCRWNMARICYHCFGDEVFSDKKKRWRVLPGGPGLGSRVKGSGDGAAAQACWMGKDA